MGEEKRIQKAANVQRRALEDLWKAWKILPMTTLKEITRNCVEAKLKQMRDGSRTFAQYCIFAVAAFLPKTGPHRENDSKLKLHPELHFWE